MSDENYVTLKQLAIELGLDKSNMRKYVLKQGVAPIKVRMSDTRGQLTLALTPEDAEAIRDLRKAQGYTEKGRVAVDDSRGWFYVVQVVPDLKLERVKLGFTANMSGRLAAYKTISPTAEIVETWPCLRQWEATAIDSLTRVDCQLVANEVFDCNDIGALVQRGNAFFDNLPNPS